MNRRAAMADESPVTHRLYPAMSHPTADPAGIVVAARFAGVDPPEPSRARILEIGCASGHHLLPLAMRWPEAEFTGIDVSAEAIRLADGLAAESGLAGRVDFRACALEDFTGGDGGYDIIIAHGFHSWVPDEVKQQLLEFCAEHLSTNGLAVVSFNVEAGWRGRKEVVRKARAIQQAGDGLDEVAALRLLKPASGDAAETAVIDDMLAKGPAILSFDDFGPVNDPWRLDGFVAAAEMAGLRWIGESRVADNRPPGWSAADEAAASNVRGTLSPVALHQWMDERARRSFRSALLCRADAPPPGKMRVSTVFDFALRPATRDAPEGHGIARRIHDALMADWPSAPLAKVLIERLPDISPQEIARVICQELIHGRLWARCEPLVIPQGIPARPALDPLRLACVRRRMPVVDAWHKPCVFPAAQWPVLDCIDGSLALEDLKSKAAGISPRLDFDRWLEHLHERGMFITP